MAKANSTTESGSKQREIEKIKNFNHGDIEARSDGEASRE